MATHTGMTTDAFQTDVKDWWAKAKHPRFDRPYSQMVYQPMIEVMKYLRDNGYKTYIVTGGGQDFVRTYAKQVYGIPPEQVVGSALDTQYAYNKEGQGEPDRQYDPENMKHIVAGTEVAPAALTVDLPELDNWPAIWRLMAKYVNEMCYRNDDRHLLWY